MHIILYSGNVSRDKIFTKLAAPILWNFIFDEVVKVVGPSMLSQTLKKKSQIK